ncbi:MAG: hypothetical protein HRU38_02210 [Saccharospirillaceae bacterium]|nr:hypothetical protein [Pseudomonadales bacterium]NRB77473.1 hypothetical protein [Saccharospirillaceae bacterium]
MIRLLIILITMSPLLVSAFETNPMGKIGYYSGTKLTASFAISSIDITPIDQEMCDSFKKCAGVFGQVSVGTNGQMYDSGFMYGIPGVVYGTIAYSYQNISKASNNYIEGAYHGVKLGGTIFLMSLEVGLYKNREQNYNLVTGFRIGL